MHFLETAGFDRHRIDAGVEKVDLVVAGVVGRCSTCLIGMGVGDRDRECRMLTALKCAGDDA